MAFKALLLGAKPPPKVAVGKLLPVPSPTSPTSNATKKKAVEPPEEERPKPKGRGREREVDPLDPAMRMSAQLAPPVQAVAIAKTEEVATRSRVSLEELIPRVVRRIAWGGDRVKGSVHLELVTGTTVTVHADGAKVRVELGGAGDHAELGRKIESRLRAAGIEVESVR